jgi:hypothetical protein
MKKNPAAQALGKLGGRARRENIGVEGFREMGRKGGKARLRTLTPKQRSAIATKASKAAAAARKKRKKDKENQ